MNEKNLKNLRSTFEMYKRTIQETKERMSQALNDDGSKKYTEQDISERVNLLKSLMDEIVKKYELEGGNAKELLEQMENDERKEEDIKLENVEEPFQSRYFEMIKNEDEDSYEDKEYDVEPLDISHESDYAEGKIEDITPGVQFDVIPLPSKGECYKSHIKTLPVAYLTANDENMIISPNLYKDGLIVDYLLKQKIQNRSIDPELLLEGDRDAIILWLRATGYGKDYPVTVTDNTTGIDFDTVVDLSKIGFKPFNLKGDENGWFDYKLPESNDDIKFRFLTHKDNKIVKNAELKENEQLRKIRLGLILDDLNNLIENDNGLNKQEKIKLFEARNSLKKWHDGLKNENVNPYTHNLTNKLELSIMSVNGNTDRYYISKYVRGMKAIDSLKLRKYIMDNEPGLDYNVEVERPESLGGGSINVFLSLDEFIFLNLA